jgi:hypothetical protein
MRIGRGVIPASFTNRRYKPLKTTTGAPNSTTGRNWSADVAEAIVRFVGGVLWQLVLYGTGRLMIWAATFGLVRAERLGGETAGLGWSGFGRDGEGGAVVSQTWAGFVGGLTWLLSIFALVLAYGPR